MSEHHADEKKTCQNIKNLSKEINRMMSKQPHFDTSEQHLYLGNYDDKYFFIHCIDNDEFVDEITHGIRSVLRSEKIISSYKDETVIIYEINKKRNLTNVCVLKSLADMTYYSRDLISDYYHLLSNDPDKKCYYLILYDYLTKSYFSYDVDRAPLKNLDHNLFNNVNSIVVINR